MRLYESSVKDFKQDVLDNRIADILAKSFLEKIGERVNESVYRSWEVSLRVLKDSLDDNRLINNKILLEYQLPYTERKIDVVLFGRNTKNQDTVVIIELKQWSNSSIKDIDIEGNLQVEYGYGLKQAAHPSLQVQGYIVDMKDFIKVFQEKPELSLIGCVYCHNYTRDDNSLLYADRFSEAIEKYPLFAKQDVRKLGEYLLEKLSKDSGFEVFNRFVNSPISPSKKLLDHVGEMIGKQQVFNLIDDQIAAYNAIMDRAKKQVKQHDKSVVIVKGGPGTGKSVIALEVMGELMRRNQTVFHATGSSAFTKTLRKIVGKRAEKFYKYFFNFTKLKENEIPVLICDEAHRIRKDSNDYAVPSIFKSKNPQIDDLIRPSKLSVFFIDEYQTVRPKEIGSVELIKISAKKLGVPEDNIFEFELKTQFRCSGSDTYLQWLENTLGIRESETQMLTGDLGMEFKIFNSPADLKKAIHQKNKEKENSARIVAGFCWPWSDPNPDGSLINDVKIEDFEMPWENKKKAWLWATDKTGMDQVGTVYTAQGFEFDYIGVIFSNDLVYDSKKEKWISKPENSYDTMAKRGNSKFTQHLENVYRVLMSRAHKGVYVYFTDEETKKFFESRIKNEI